jgi:hypothetical protein
MVFVNASRTKDAISKPEMEFMKGLLNSSTLSPYHAKILLQLTLDGLRRQQPEVMALVAGLHADATTRERVQAIWKALLYDSVPLPIGI